MSSDYTIILPLMVCVVISTVIGRRLLRYTVYEMKLLRRGIDWEAVRRPRFLSRVRISAIERPAPLTASPQDKIEDVARRLTGTPELVVPVCDGDRFVGIVRSSDVAHAMSVGEGIEPIRSLVQNTNEYLSPTDPVERAATLMASDATPLLPVVDPQSRQFIGIVTRRDVLLAYVSAAER